MILIFAWAFSGPVTAVVLTGLAAIASFYLALSAREPAIFLQCLIYAALFLCTVYYLYKVQNLTNDRKIMKEKITEQVYLTQEEIRKKDLIKAALESKIDRLMGLQRFAMELKESATPKEAGQKIVLECYEALGKADECVLYLVNETRQELSLLASTRSGGEIVKEKEGTIFDKWVMKRFQPIMVEDAPSDFRFPKDIQYLASTPLSLCASPLVTENKVIGVVRVSSNRSRAFTSDDLRLLDIFSSLGAVTLRNILLHQRMEELAIRDGLTGLYLNRYFQERLTEEIQRAQLDKTHFSVLLIDIDFFKRYNDEYGHAAGDNVLKIASGLISKTLEPADFVARYGGEEFVVFLPNKSKRQARAVAEKIRAGVERHKFLVRRIEGRVTVSIGVSTFPENGRSREELLWAADHKLYEAKRKGRNRVCGGT